MGFGGGAFVYPSYRSTAWPKGTSSETWIIRKNIFPEIRCCSWGKFDFRRALAHITLEVHSLELRRMCTGQEGLT